MNWRAKIITKGRDANDVWMDRCAGYCAPGMSPDEAEAYRADRQLTDEGLAAARAFGLDEFTISALLDFVLVRERGDHHEKLYFERDQFRVEYFHDSREAWESAS
jgi:hypothetical protein